MASFADFATTETGTGFMHGTRFRIVCHRHQLFVHVLQLQTCTAAIEHVVASNYERFYYEFLRLKANSTRQKYFYFRKRFDYM